MSNRYLKLVAALAVFLGSQAAMAADSLKLAVGNKGSWPTSIPELGSKAGIFKKHGLDIEITYTAGGGETMQPLISGAVDVGVAMAAAQVMSAYVKGAPVRIIGTSVTGVGDLMWFVKADSPIKTIKDARGASMAISSTGSSSSVVANALIAEYKIDAKAVPTGNLTSTFTATMSGQVDIGWTAPPVLFKPLNEGQIRILITGADATRYKDQSARVIAANAGSLQQKADAIKRFAEGYRETVDWLYSDDPKALAAMADLIGQNVDIAKQTRDVYPKESVEFDRKTGIQAINEEAVGAKFIDKVLTPEQIKDLYVEIGK